MNLNYVDEDNCPVVLTLTLRELERLINAIKDLEGVGVLHTELTTIRTDAIGRGERAFKYMAEREAQG